MRQTLLSLIILLAVIAAAAQRTTQDIAYGPHDRNNLIVSSPDNAESKTVVVWFHGGGLVGGNASIPKELEDTDYVIVAPNYRFLTTDSIDACIDDAAAAVAWTFNNIAKYGGEPSKIFVSGHSAGGYLASLIGFDKTWLDRYGVDADSIKGLIPFSGQAITHYEWRKMTGGDPLRPDIDRYAPIFHIRKDAPPYVIVSGDRELELFGRYEENAYMWRMMKLIGHPYVEIYELQGYDHGAMASPAFHILKKTVDKLNR